METEALSKLESRNENSVKNAMHEVPTAMGAWELSSWAVDEMDGFGLNFVKKTENGSGSSIADMGAVLLILTGLGFADN